MPRASTAGEFIDRARTVHGDRYDYGQVAYAGANTKVSIVCAAHGTFRATPNNHVHRRSGCPDCAPNRRLTTETYIETAQAKHGNRYDYSLTQYAGRAVPILVTCLAHGPFKQNASDHLGGAGCPSCGRERTTVAGRYDTSQFADKGKAVHGDIYDYSSVEYVESQIKVVIICGEHGSFEQTPANHLRGQGCPRCGGTATHTVTSFVAAAKAVHGERYGYDAVVYEGNKIAVTLDCPDHGPFNQLPCHHLKGSGCPSCSQSHGEAAVRRVLDDLGEPYVAQWTHPTLRLVRPLKADFALPHRRLLIEFDGIQHRQPTSFGRDSETVQREFEATQARDAAKDAWAAANGWALIRLTDVATVAEDLAAVLSEKAAA